jgi:hypothetical protein
MKLAVALVASVCLVLPGCSKEDEPGQPAGDPPAESGEQAAEPGIQPAEPVAEPTAAPKIPSLNAMLGAAKRRQNAPAEEPGSLLAGLGLGLGSGPGSSMPAYPGTPPAAAAPGAPTPGAAANQAASTDCKKVGDKLAALVKQEMTKQLDQIPAQQRAMVEQQLAATDAMLAQLPQQLSVMCTTGSWPKNLTDCILQASDVSAIQQCESLMTAHAAARSWEDEDWAALEAELDDDLDLGAATPVGPAPKWDGKRKDCAAVGAHVKALALHQLSGAPAAQQAMAQDLLAQVETMVAGECTRASWPEPTRLCILKAQSEDALDDCGAM